LRSVLIEAMLLIEIARSMLRTTFQSNLIFTLTGV
jgi:hypothetical protein